LPAVRVTDGPAASSTNGARRQRDAARERPLILRGLTKVDCDFNFAVSRAANTDVERAQSDGAFARSDFDGIDHFHAFSFQGRKTARTANVFVA
jgi:hypothetical protein